MREQRRSWLRRSSTGDLMQTMNQKWRGWLRSIRIAVDEDWNEHLNTTLHL